MFLKNKTTEMLCIRHRLQEQEIQDETPDNIAQPLRLGTASRYQKYISKWVIFCCERNSDPYRTNVNNDLSFLQLLF